MGNDNAKTELKNAKLYELQATYLKRYIAHGDNLEETLANLRVMCNDNGIPDPKKIGDTYICGTVDIPYTFNYQKRLNPVWFRERNGRHSACVYYSDL